MRKNTNFFLLKMSGFFLANCHHKKLIPAARLQRTAIATRDAKIKDNDKDIDSRKDRKVTVIRMQSAAMATRHAACATKL